MEILLFRHLILANSIRWPTCFIKSIKRREGNKKITKIILLAIAYQTGISIFSIFEMYKEII